MLTVSRGEKGLKIPAGFARIDPDEPLIRFFTQHYDKKIFDAEVLELKKLKYSASRGLGYGKPNHGPLASGRLKKEELNLLRGWSLKWRCLRAPSVCQVSSGIIS